MRTNNSVVELLDYLQNLPFDVMEGVDEFLIVGDNSVYEKINLAIKVIAKRVNEALPNTNVRPTRGISRNKFKDKNSNVVLRVFNCVGLDFSDDTKFLLTSFGNNSLEIIKLTIGEDKKGMGLDELILELIIAELIIHLQYVPTLVIRKNPKHPFNKRQNQVLTKLGFIDDEEEIAKRKEEQILV
jgi:hypothetical protein